MTLLSVWCRIIAAAEMERGRSRLEVADPDPDSDNATDDDGECNDAVLATGVSDPTALEDDWDDLESRKKSLLSLVPLDLS